MSFAWWFPGQGSQEVGMGKALAESSAAARDVFRRVDEALGEPLSKLCFEGPIEELTLTRNTQPALVATSCAIVAAIREAHPSLPPPALAMGHSLGEYAALVAAGALTLEDAVRICRARGEAMQAAVPAGTGGMSAIVALADDVVAAICEEARAKGAVQPANYNAPGQVVIAGEKEALAEAGRLAEARGGKAIPLNVSAPFHSSLMRPAAERVAAELANVKLGPMAFPVVANVDGEPNTDPERVRELLVRQVDAPVQWVRSSKKATALGVTLALEIGPGKVLATMQKRIDKTMKVVSVNDVVHVAELRSILGV
jgi:[acyl-carrier-protein] S-malonyltransferase